MSRIAVTGARGLVGRFVLADLQARGYEVRALTHAWWSECPVPDQVEGDIRDFDWVKRSLDGCSAVIHLAGIPSPRVGNDSDIIQTNVGGTYHIFLAAGELGIPRVACASSDCTFGFTFSRYRPQPEYLPVDELHPTRPDDSYGLSKLLAERAADAVVQRFPGMYAASLRISHVVGPEDYEPDAEFASWRGNPLLGPWNLWSYIDGRDAARAFRLAVESSRTGHDVFCIASRQTRSAIPSRELARQYFPHAELRDLAGHESLEDSRRAARLLGFTAEH